jgi:hypothetical protein
MVFLGRRPRAIRPARQGPGPSAVFRPDMMGGEGDGAFAERMVSLGQGLSQKKYGFQVRNDDGVDHFRKVSRRYPELKFVLSYDGTEDPARGWYCSCFIRQGRSTEYIVPQDSIDAVMSKHGIDYNSIDNEIDWWDEPSWELMDLAESHWLTRVVKRLRRDNPAGEPGGR